MEKVAAGEGRGPRLAPNRQRAKSSGDDDISEHQCMRVGNASQHDSHVTSGQACREACQTPTPPHDHRFPEEATRSQRVMGSHLHAVKEKPRLCMNSHLATSQ